MEVTEIRGLWREAMRSIIGITLLVAAGLLGSRSDKPLKSLYLLAATPTAYRSATYPATLYSIGEKQKLHLLRTVVPGTDGVEFVLSSPNFLVIGHPTVSAKIVTFVHFGAPLIPDAIRIGARVKSGALGAFLIDGIGSDPTVGLTCFQNGSPCFSGVHVQPISEGDRRLVESLGWSRLEDIWFGGSIGGADIGFGTTEPTLGSQGLDVYSPQGIIFIARLKTPIITEPEIPAQLLCSNDQFVVASRNKVDSSPEINKTLDIQSRLTNCFWTASSWRPKPVSHFWEALSRNHKPLRRFTNVGKRN